MAAWKQRPWFNLHNFNVEDYLQINHHQLEVPGGDIIDFLFYFLFFLLKRFVFSHVPSEIWQRWKECEESTGEKWAYKKKI
jgi:hypothetical protein